MPNIKRRQSIPFYILLFNTFQCFCLNCRQKFTFDLKSYNLLSEITVLDNESQTSSETNKEKENNNNLLNIKSRVSNTRDLIAKEEEKEVFLSSNSISQLMTEFFDYMEREEN